MKYMTIVSQTQPDGTVNAAMTVHDEYQKAVSAFHLELAYGAISDKLASGARLWGHQRQARERHGNARRHHRTRVRDLRRAGTREACGGRDDWYDSKRHARR